MKQSPCLLDLALPRKLAFPHAPMLSIGPFSNPSNVIVAPMAGVTDLPFRQLCRGFGSSWAVSEMVTSDTSLWHTAKSRHRLRHDEGDALSWVQLAGSEPDRLAAAAVANVELGADIIDINMGCPAKKVCNKAAGSALLRDEQLVASILKAVVDAVDVPVTLKIRLGWSKDEQNASQVAQIAAAAGIQLLTVHGRTRACRFSGEVDYAAIAQVRQSVEIPVIANGDIQSAQQARRVLEMTGCSGVMIGRAAQGRPWLPAQIDAALNRDEDLRAPGTEAVQQMLVNHLKSLHEFYGVHQGIRIARKHIGWTMDYLIETGAASKELKRAFNHAESAYDQFMLLDRIGTTEQAA